VLDVADVPTSWKCSVPVTAERAFAPAGAALAGAANDSAAATHAMPASDAIGPLIWVLLLIDVAIPPQTGPARKRWVAG
jgi:hypothetical protein